MGDLLFAAKYPFTKEAKEYLASARITLSPSIIEKGEERARNALEKGIVLGIATNNEDVLSLSVASYAACRMIVSALKSRYYIKRYAVAEAKRAGKYIRAEKDGRNIGRIEEELGLHFFENKGRIFLPVLEYLKYSPKSVDYKLVNRKLAKGLVELSRQEKFRLIEEAIRKNIESSLPIIAAFPKEVKEAAERVRKILPKEEFGERRVGAEGFPPCIKKLLEDLRMSENLPHNARWALAVYLLSTGMRREEVVRIFSSAPDFKEETTLYQVEHILKKGYSVPSCATFDSYGICVSNCGCRSPRNYRKVF